MFRTPIPVRLAIALTALAQTTLPAQPVPAPFDSLYFRSIGPAASGGRIHDLQIDPRPLHFFAAQCAGRPALLTG